MLDHADFKRLELTTKMVKTIQKYQKLLEKDAVVEEPEEQDDEQTTEEDNNTDDSISINKNKQNSFFLEKVCITITFKIIISSQLWVTLTNLTYSI